MKLRKRALGKKQPFVSELSFENSWRKTLAGIAEYGDHTLHEGFLGTAAHHADLILSQLAWAWDWLAGGDIRADQKVSGARVVRR